MCCFLTAVLNVLFLNGCFVVVFRLCIVLVVFFGSCCCCCCCCCFCCCCFVGFLLVGCCCGVVVVLGVVYLLGGGVDTCFGSVFKSKIHLFLHPYSAGPCPDSPLRHSPLSDHHTQHLECHQQVTIVRLGLVTADYVPTGIAL